MLNKRIAAAMAHAKLTPAMLVAKTGATKGSVSFWLSGKTKNLKSETALAIAEATGVCHAWLVNGQGDMLATSSHDSYQTADTSTVGLSAAAIKMAKMFDLIVDGSTDQRLIRLAHAAASSAINAVFIAPQALPNDMPLPAATPKKSPA